MSLLGPNGQPISSDSFAKSKASKSIKNPLIGEIAPGYGKPAAPNFRMPLQNTMQFDTSRLTLADYRLMRDHYQINSSLSVLTFMLHQADWKIVGGDEKARKHVQYNMEKIWTRLTRAMAQAFWAGYASCALQWENDDSEDKVMLTKVKDLPQEDCRVHWKKMKAVGGGGMTSLTDSEGLLSGSQSTGSGGYTKIFDGIDQVGYKPIPVGNAFWYPVFMEHGNYYGRKLLNSAFQPWFFSQLIHMYSNRYFERFGEPVMVARAPYDEKINVNGNDVDAYTLMQGLARQVRNGATAILPNDMKMNGTDDSGTFEYTLEYLESQMRGADFERYLTRLDEEMSLALFTPLLLLRTAESGSFNLGVGHTQMYLWQLNAILEDWKEYIDKYIINSMTQLNFPGAKNPEIKFRKLGTSNPETVRLLLGALVGAGKVMPDLEELGQVAGLTLEEVEQVIEPPTKPGEVDENGDPKQAAPVKNDPKAVPINPTTKSPKDVKRDNRISRPDKNKAPKGTDKRAKIKSGMSKRLLEQLKAGHNEPDIGYHAQFTHWLDETWGADSVWHSDTDAGWFADCQTMAEQLFDNFGSLDIDPTVAEKVIGGALDSFFDRVETAHYANQE